MSTAIETAEEISARTGISVSSLRRSRNLRQAPRYATVGGQLLFPAAGATASEFRRAVAALSCDHGLAKGLYSRGVSKRRRRSIPPVLWHGTTSTNWEGIQRDGIARVDRAVGNFCTTTEFMVSVYFAHNAVPGWDGEPVVLRVDGAGLVEEGYDLQWYEDSFFGEGQHEWEKEVAIWEDIPAKFISFAGLVSGIPQPDRGWPGNHDE